MQRQSKCLSDEAFIGDWADKKTEIEQKKNPEHRRGLGVRNGTFTSPHVTLPLSRDTSLSRSSLPSLYRHCVFCTPYSDVYVSQHLRLSLVDGILTPCLAKEELGRHHFSSALWLHICSVAFKSLNCTLRMELQESATPSYRLSKQFANNC